MSQRKIVIFCLFILVTAHLSAQANGALEKCWQKQVKPVQELYLTCSFTENRNELEHSFEPWQQTQYNSAGTFWCNADSFMKTDSLTFRGKAYNSKLQSDKSTLLFLDYGDKELFAVTQSMFLDQQLKTIRYSPIGLINYFFQHKIPAEIKSNSEFTIYKTTINKSIVTLFIRKSDNLLDKITVLSNDELFGDVVTTLLYADYATVEKLVYPKTIKVEKIDGKVKDEIKISTAKMDTQAPKLLEKPADYKLKEDVVAAPEIKRERYSDNIHFIELKHTDDKVLVVEFDDFLLVAEAPLNSENGELIINEAKKIAPRKPIRYFVFGHYHPHYIGGIRPFIHEGAKILCSQADKEYVEYLAKAPHTLVPDSLQLEQQPLLIEEIKDKLTVSDGKLTMEIYFIGEKSQHTKDYLIYYFPTEKLLFEDDLVWITKVGDMRKASPRQAGLYNAIKELGLEVNTIIQSWPVADYGVKTVIPFADLEKSMDVE